MLTIGLKEIGREEFSLQEKHSFSGLETQDQNLKMYLEAPVTKVSNYSSSQLQHLVAKATENYMNLFACTNRKPTGMFRVSNCSVYHQY